MAAGRINRGDIETPLTPVELIELYKTFIGIQNNKLSRLFEPKVFQGLMEGLYLNADPEMQSMMRMYEFFDIDGIAILDMFDNSQPRRQTGTLTPPPTSRTG